MLESLESRRLLSVSASVSNGILTVTGDNDANAVAISRNDAGQILVRVNDVTIKSATYSEITGINVSLLGGNDRTTILTGVEKPTTLSGGDGNDTLNGGSGKDSISGGGGNDQLNGNNGADSLYGNDGNDTLNGGSQADLMSGGGGVDVVTYAGRTGAVKVTLDNVNNDGFQGNTTEPGEGDNVKSDVERIVGGNGNDSLSGAGAPAGVTLEGGSGNDSLSGGSFSDSLIGGGGNDSLKGNDGNDSLNGGEGGDFLSGGGGSDLVSYSDRNVGVVVTSGDNSANDGTPERAATATEPFRPAEHDNVQSDVERLAGTRYADRISGSDANNTISGGDGNDTLNGNGGNDVIEGGGGNDSISGGTGNDSLYGGNGEDKLFGNDGDDWLYGHDGVKDSLDGGGGSDHGQRDENLDVLTSIETIVPNA